MTYRSNSEQRRDPIIAAYVESMWGIQLLSVEREKELFAQKRDLQKHLLTMICNYDWTILARALGEYAFVERLNEVYPQPLGFSGGPYGCVDYSIFAGRCKKSCTAFRLEPYLHILKLEVGLEQARIRDRPRILEMIAEEYSNGLYYPPFEGACKDYLNRRVYNASKTSSKGKLSKIQKDISDFSLDYFRHQEVRSILINSNLRLVLDVVKRYKNSVVDINDLIAEGNIGLIKAVDLFRLGYGKLSTYAVWNIRQAIGLFLKENSRNVRIPMHRQEEIWKVVRAQKALYIALGRPPSFSEVDESLGCKAGWSEKILCSSIVIVSLNAPLKGGESSELGDILEDGRFLRAEESVQRAELRNKVRAALSFYEKDSRDYRVITRLFGIGFSDRATLEEVGDAEGLTKERIRVIRDGILFRLGRRENIKRLRDSL